MSTDPNPAYINMRADMVALVEQPWSSLLDIGCAQGATASFLRDQRPGARAVGVELDPALAAVAAGRLDEVLVMDAVSALELLVEQGRTFDLVICGDILEHLSDPWAALKLIRALCPAGHVLISLPNVAHYSTLVALLREQWPYNTRGIHDQTHLRWFARHNLVQLFDAAGFVETRRVVKHRLIEQPHWLNPKVEPLLRKLPLLRRYTVFQFLCVLRPR